MKSAEVTNSYDAIRDKIVCDQFISSANSELRTFIEERTYPSLADVVNCAENYGAAHPSVYKSIAN